MIYRHIPNLISVFRLLLVPPVIALILAGRHQAALGLVLVAGLSDALDGFLAKRYGWTSELGSILDPLADKLLVVSAVLALLAIGLLPLWLAALVVARDLVIVIGALSYRYFIGSFRIAPSLISKLNTGVLILLILAVIAGEILDRSMALEPLLLLCGCTVIASGVDYVIRWGLKARRELAAGRAARH
ncbi:MAG: hypothetical protein GX093_13105 [Xanthomonadaceae bacterium]|nr:hypothetical protein [Xanthomonadaceae bacterium]